MRIRRILWKSNVGVMSVVYASMAIKSVGGVISPTPSMGHLDWHITWPDAP